MTDVKDKAKEYSEEQKRALATREANQQALVQSGGDSMLMNPAVFEQAQRVAAIYADSDLVPDHFQKKPSNVFVALELAERLGVNPFMLMQRLYVVYGKPGMEAQLVIALMNTRGPFTGPVQWVFKGEGKARSCTAFATHRKTGKTCEATVDWDMVVKEGWYDKKGSKWKTMPNQMFQYRSAAFLARLHCPEVMMGLSTTDEIEDVHGEVLQAVLEPMPDDDNADVPEFTAPKDDSREGPLVETEQPAESDDKHKATTADTTASRAVKIEAVVAKAVDAGAPAELIERWKEEVGISKDGRKNKGKDFVAKLEALDEKAMEWLTIPDNEPGSPAPTNTPAPTAGGWKADEHEVMDLFDAMKVRFGHVHESDVLRETNTLLGFPDGLKSLSDLTKTQCAAAIAKCKAGNGKAQGEQGTLV